MYLERNSFIYMASSTISCIRPFHKESPVDITIKFVLFLISPFLSFFYSLRTMNRKSSYVCFFLFALFWSMIQCPDLGKSLDDGSDMAAYRLIFDRLLGYDEVSFAEFWILSGFGKSIFSYGFLYLVSRITTNYHWFVVILGIIVSFLQLKCFRFITSSPSFHNGALALIIGCMFSMHAPLYWIGGIRWILAAWITVYATLEIWANQNKRFWVLLSIVPIIHYSFFVYALVFIIAHFTMKHSRFWAIALAFSFLFQFVVTALFEYLQAMQNVLPSFVFGTLGDVEFMEEQEKRIQSLGFAARIISVYFMPFFPTFLAYFFYLKRNEIKEKSQIGYSFFQLSLVLTFFYNILSVVPDLGRRLGFIIFIYYAVVMAYCFFNKKNMFIYLFYLFCASVTLYSDIRGEWIYLTDLSDWFTNPFFLVDNYLVNPKL